MIKKKLGFVGLGKLGMPCAEVLATKYKVYGYDNRKTYSKKIKILNSLKKLVYYSDIIFIALPTPHHPKYDGSTPTSHLKNKDFSYTIVKSCIKKINTFALNKKTIVLISTVLPGTVRKILSKELTKCELIYNPYLIAMGSVGWDMVNPEMIIAGNKDAIKNSQIKELFQIYKSVMKNKPRFVFGTWEEAECVKIFYNTFISAKIGLVNMILDVSEKIKHINVDVVTNALANSKQRIMSSKYMTAGMGDGGACHPRDNIALRFLASSQRLGYDLFDAIMKAREVQAKNLAKKMISIAINNKMDIYIHGEAYKPLTPYKDGSYSLLVGHYINNLYKKPIYIDPHTRLKNPKSIKGVILMAHNSNITYKENKLHHQKLYSKILDSSIVIDPWRNFKTNNKNIKVIHYGNTR
jgi:UDPglucose 6-dehydrogenase